MRILIALAFVASACGFEPGAFGPDAAPDGPPPITVGFAQPTSMTDETPNVVEVRVVLSAASDVPVTVGFAITGGTATRTVDYLADDGTLTFAPGDVEQTIEVTVGPDGMEEPDETVQIELQSVTGGAVLATSLHTLTIAANILPRVSFALASSMGAEATSPAIEVVLDTPSPIQVTVSINVNGGTATSGGVDYGLSSTTVSFAPGNTSEQITLSVNNDALDEDDEQAIIELANPVNVIVGTTATRTHTIEDDDLPPTVSFASASSTVGEGAGSTDLTVSLSAASGKAIAVAIGVDGASSAAGTDYTIPASSLLFPAGTTSRTVTVNITQDSVVEPAETVIVELGTLTNVTAGAIQSHTVTITDDDQVCLGAGAYTLCFPTQSMNETVSGAIDTDTSPRCEAAPLSGWTGQPSSCFIVGQNITIGATQVTGSRPLVLFATGTITVTGTLDVASHRGGTSGPGANASQCAAFPATPDDDTNGAGGGAGGSFRSRGGDGGEGNNTNNSEGIAPNADASAPTVLRGGCAGQDGGDGDGANGGTGGAGGGAVYLVAGGVLTINTGVTINASGAAGTAHDAPNGGHDAGGGGGGSGGMIKLHAASFSVNGARLMANGGGGSSGGDIDGAGSNGNDPNPATPNTAATGGPSGLGGGTGGNGFAGTNQATSGADQGNNNGGGGGGGGGGHIESNLALTGATVSAGGVVP